MCWVGNTAQQQERLTNTKKKRMAKEMRVLVKAEFHLIFHTKIIASEITKAALVECWYKAEHQRITRRPRK